MSLQSKEFRALLANKANKITFGHSKPLDREGKDGDITIRNIGRLGNHLCIKSNGSWYYVPLSHKFISSDDMDRIMPTRPPKYRGEIGFEKNTGEFHFKQSNTDFLRYAGSTTKINRDVNDGNPTLQLGSSDAECFKITSTYTSGAKGLSSVTFDTLTASGTADMGEYFFKVDAIEKLHLDDNALTITTEGSATADTSILYLRNRGNHATAMANTRASIEFQQKLNDLGTETFRDSGKITVGTIGNEWGNTASEQDSYMSFSVALNGTMSEYMKINSDGTVGVGTNKYLTLSDNEIDVSSGNLTLDAAGQIALTPGDNQTVTIDANCTLTENNTNTGLMIDYDHTAGVAIGNTVYNEGVEVDLRSNSPTHYGTVVNKAYSAALTGGTSGGQTGYAFYGTVDGHDTNNGIYLNVTDGGTDIMLVSSADVGDYCTIKTTTHGATAITTVDDDAAAANLTLDPDGDLIIKNADVKIKAGKKIYFDDGGDTYIFEHSADHVRLYVGGDNVMRFSETSDGNQVNFIDSSAGFTQLEPTFNGINTTVNFRASNKQNLTLTNNLTNLNLYFPLMSGNFTLVVTQDGTGSRTISNYKAFDNAGNAANGSATVKFPGGSNPTLTTATNHVDIISFYWDCDNEIAYGVATLDFQD